MSNSQQHVDEVRNYAEEIGLNSVPLSVAKLVVQLCWHDDHVPLLIGESSTGKTAGIQQLGRFNDANVVPFHLGNVDSSDIRGPAFPQPNGTFKYLPPGNVPIEWSPSTRQRRVLQELEEVTGKDLEYVLSNDFSVTDVEDVFDAKDLDVLFEIREGVEKEKAPTALFFDELNRGSKDAMNSVMSVWTEKLLGGAKLGPNVRLAAAMNPPGGSYAVNSQISNDPAMRRRLCQIVVHFSPQELLRYAEDPARSTSKSPIPPVEFDGKREEEGGSDAWHPRVIDFMRQNPDLQLDTKSREAGKVYSCPSTWEAVSKTMKTVERLQLDIENPLMLQVVRTKLAGHLGYTTSIDFLSFYKENREFLDPVDILHNYADEEASAHKQIQRILKSGEYANLIQVLESSVQWIFSNDEEDFDMEEIVPSMGMLFADLPPNISQELLTKLSDISEEMVGPYNDKLQELMRKLLKNDNYRKFQKRSLQLSTKSQEAADS